MKQLNVPKSVFEEVKKRKKMNFKYLDKSNPVNLAFKLSDEANIYPI